LSHDDDEEEEEKGKVHVGDSRGCCDGDIGTTRGGFGLVVVVMVVVYTGDDEKENDGSFPPCHGEGKRQTFVFRNRSVNSPPQRMGPHEK